MRVLIIMPKSIPNFDKRVWIQNVSFIDITCKKNDSKKVIYKDEVTRAWVNFSNDTFSFLNHMAMSVHVDLYSHTLPSLIYFVNYHGIIFPSNLVVDVYGEIPCR